jgi:hypothetical protein
MVAQKVTQAAADAAESMLSQAPAPTASCCDIGKSAFAESEAMLLTESVLAFGELAESQATLQAEFAVSENGWNTVEQSLQVKGAPAWVVNNVIAESRVTEAAWLTSEAGLASAVSNAESAIGLAESYLQAEAAWFTANACTTG